MKSPAHEGAPAVRTVQNPRPAGPRVGGRRVSGLGDAGQFMPALALTPPSRAARRLARGLLWLFLVLLAVLAFVPWRQSVEGAGRVVGLSPLDREFVVEAPISGRVMKWFVGEGDAVRGPRREGGMDVPGDLIAKLSDNDPQYLEVLETQVASVKDKLENARQQAETYGDVARTLEDLREQAIEVEQNALEIARQKLAATDRDLEIARVDRETSLIQRDRYKRLLPQGLIAGRDMEMAEQKYNTDDQKYKKTQLERKQAEYDVEAKEAKMAEVTQKTKADVSKTNADVQAARQKIAEYAKELAEAEAKLRAQQTQDVRAPRDGVVERLLVNEVAQQVKDGEPLAVLVPTARQFAVELYLSGNDVPLVQPGDDVRLQFEGWPAVQFLGWPSVAVGTFAGRVRVLDPSESGAGKFRIIVEPIPGRPWPSSRYLRQGALARGWVLLREVPLWFEFWRRLNAFPPSLSGEPAGGTGKDKTREEGSSSAANLDGDKDKVKVKRPK